MEQSFNCFVCMKVFKPESELDRDEISLKCLGRHLGTREDLKVKCCKDCLKLVDKFNEVYGRFEVIEMELNYYLELIQNKFRVKGDEVQELNGISRDIILSKCDQKMSKRMPIVKVERWQVTSTDEEEVPMSVSSHEDEELLSSDGLEDPLFEEGQDFTGSESINFEDEQAISKYECSSPVIVKVEAASIISDDDSWTSGMSNKEPEGAPSLPRTLTNVKYEQDYNQNQALFVNESSREKKSDKQGRLQKNRTVPGQLIRKSVTINYKTNETVLRANYCNESKSCLLCKKPISQFGNFKVHFEMIHLKLRFTCDICQAGYCTRQILREHLRKVHPGHYQEPQRKKLKGLKRMENKADHVNVTINHKTNEDDLRANYDEITKSCGFCQKSFRDFSAFTKHFEGVHLNLRFACDICQINYSRRESLREHCRKVHPERYQGNAAEKNNRVPVPLGHFVRESEFCANYTLSKKCRLCNKSFPLLTTFKSHYEAVHLKLRFVCNVCNAVFYSRAMLRAHLLRNPPLHGKEVKQKLSSLTGLITTSAVKERNEEVRHNFVNNQCSLCYKKFTSFRYFKQHYEIAHLRLRFTCDLCSYSFPQRSKLRLHLLKRHPERYQKYQAERTKEFKTPKKPENFVDLGVVPKQEVAENDKMEEGKTAAPEVLAKVKDEAVSGVEAPTTISSKLISRINNGTAAQQSSFLKPDENKKFQLQFSCEVCGKACNEMSKLKLHLRIFHPQQYKAKGYSFRL